MSATERSRPTAAERLLASAGGLCGAAGVVLSAVAAHHGGRNLGIAATFLLAHAPALLAIGLASRFASMPAAIRAGGLIMLVGVVLFAGDLVMLDLAGRRPFPMAAPTGGTLTILGWLVVAAAALLPGRRSA